MIIIIKQIGIQLAALSKVHRLYIQFNQSHKEIIETWFDQNLSIIQTLMKNDPPTQIEEDEESQKTIVSLYKCLGNELEAFQYDRFLSFCKDFVEQNRDNQQHSCHHLYSHLMMLIDSIQWPIPSRDLDRLIELQNQVMEEKIIKKSNFLIKEGFDLGLQKHYSHVAFAVQHSLKLRGFNISENSDLMRDKKMLSETKKELLKIKSKDHNIRIPLLPVLKTARIEPSPMQSPRNHPIRYPRMRMKNHRRSTDLNELMRKQPTNSIDAYFMYDQVQNLKSEKSQQSFGKSM